MRICMSCNKFIGIKEHYFEVIENKDKKVIGRKFVHKNCQDTYDKNLKDNLLTPEKKQQMAKMVILGLKKVKELQSRIREELQ